MDVSFAILSVLISPDLHEMNGWGEHARTAKIMLVLFQVASMLIAAKILGWLCERIRVPGVVGELLAGVIIGPYLLGHLVQIPLAGHYAPLFPAPSGSQWPLNDVIWSLAQFASIVLLFITGLHTNLDQFVRYIRPAALVAVAGLVVPFALGTATVYYVPQFEAMARGTPEDSLIVPALFVGAILAATSIGITARVLGDLGKLDTPEGVTILGAAVLDDVLGIIALAIVGGIASAGVISPGEVGAIAGKAFGFWIGLTLLVLVLSRRIEWALKRIRYSGAMIGLALALAFVCSAAAESFGLAFIIGAYSVGLGLSRTQLAHKLMDELEPIASFIVPIFFAALGMLVNVQAMLANRGAIIFGLVITLMAIIGKLIGCGAAALPTGFNTRGAYRIGLGMLPRGEVALIVAGIGLSRQIIGEVVFGVSIMMTLITTIIAPILLVPAFARGGSGRRKPRAFQLDLPGASIEPGFDVLVPRSLARLFIGRLLEAAQNNQWEPSYDQADGDIYVLRSRGDAAQMVLDGDLIHISASGSRQQEFAELVNQVRESLVREAESVSLRPNPPDGAEVSS